MSTALSAPPLSPAQEHEHIPDWKHQLAERLGAYRAKHREEPAPPPTVENSITPKNSRASKIARTVASRYAAAPTYSELLLAAAEAEKRAAEAQRALTEHVASQALAAAEKFAEQELAEQERAQLLLGADLAPEIESVAEGFLLPGMEIRRPETSTSTRAEDAFAQRYGGAIHTEPLTPGTPVMPKFTRNSEMHTHQTAPEPEPSFEDLWASSLVEPRALLPSKLIEFPRELISARRARPKMENPTDPMQLRIFEVQPEEDLTQPGNAGNYPDGQRVSAATGASTDASDVRISAEATRATDGLSATKIGSKNSAVIAEESVQRSAVNGTRDSSNQKSAAGTAPRSAAGYVSTGSSARAFKGLEWAAISLDKQPEDTARRLDTRVADAVPFLVDPAPIDRRLMAFAVDFAAVTSAFLAFLVVFAAATPHMPTGLTAGMLAGAVYVSLWVLYQMLFFSLSGSTAGMSYARIALCTFDDQNPTRAALRRRLMAWWLACLPVGLGFLWCFVDEDNLGWHDRMARMYQREY